MSSLAEEILSEVRRLEALVFIRRTAANRNRPDVPSLASWLEIDADRARSIVAELMEDEFVSSNPAGGEFDQQLLRLTDLGNGFLRYLEQRSKQEEAFGSSCVALRRGAPPTTDT